MIAIKGRSDAGLTGKEQTLPGDNQFITNLTPIRGIAALLVVIFHFEIVLVLFLPRDISQVFQ